MFKKILICSALVSFFIAQGSQDKDYFIIEVKRKGGGAVNILPPEKYNRNVFNFYVNDPNLPGDVPEKENLKYENLNFTDPLQFPNTIISEGYKWVNIIAWVEWQWGDTPEELRQHKLRGGNRRLFMVTFKVKPGHHYLLSMPTIRGKFKEEKITCPTNNVSKEKSDLAPFLCVTETKI